ncbi:acyl transferase/acyl hydrolase/lysophospholipase [Flagelloscypha sp. PMI_526]|nr:acyl transferase/acyl hydrolase/lysophospholipase [Flagelloscypha sp. PMI_526]
MSDSLPRTKGLRLLCFDGGGLCCLSQALLMREILGRLQHDTGAVRSLKVTSYFDMIGGSGFGGLLAIMAGILDMTIDELVSEFSALCAHVFSDAPTTQKRTSRLEEAVKCIIEKYSKDNGGEGRNMLSSKDNCKVFVCASSSTNLAFPHIFRNYIVRGNTTADCAVWQAACATMAMPGLFEPVEIGTGVVRESVVSGEHRWSNPVRYLAEEAATVFSGHYVACIVSIGSGHPHILSVSDDLASLFKRISTDCQLQANETEARFMEVPGLYWRLEVEQGLQGLQSIEDVAAFSRILSSTSSYLQRSGVTQKIDALLEILRIRPEYVPTRAITGKVLAEARTVRLKQCPYPTLYFTGKEAELKEMSEYFNSSCDGCRICVLYGLGGGGKTQLGLKFVQLSRKKHRFTDIFFVDASDINTLHNDLKALAKERTAGTTIESALDYLSSREDDWLLFLDNADDPSLDFRPFVSWSHGNVLITTRNIAVRAHAPDCRLRIHSLTMDESVALLLRGLDLRMDEKTESAAAEIVEELGFLPLAISHARAYLEYGSCDLEDSLRIYRSDHQSLLQKRPVQSTDDYEYSVYATWMLGFKKLSAQAVVFLQLICFFHHEGIPSRIVEMAYQKQSGRNDYFVNYVPQSIRDFLSHFENQGETWTPSRFHLLLNEILSLSLIQSDLINYTLSFHPLVQKLLRSLFETKHDNITASQTFLSLALPTGGGTDDYARRRRFVVHLRSIKEYGIRAHPLLLFPFGRAYFDAGKHSDACRIWEAQVEGMTRLFGREHPYTLRSMNNLGISYRDLGRAVDALPLEQQVLDLRKRILGPEHPDTLLSMNTLAISYRDLGRAAEALPLDEKCLELRKKILGPEHPETLYSMSSLANSYTMLGRASDALPLNKQALELRRKILGPEHPETLSSMTNLADSYLNLGRAEDALPLNEQALELRKRTLGPEHPYTLLSMSRLAISYRDLGLADDALPLGEQVLELKK